MGAADHESSTHDTDCPICMEAVDPWHKLTLHGGRHWVCRDCVPRLILSHRDDSALLRCPMCREPVDVERLNNLLHEESDDDDASLIVHVEDEQAF